MFLLFKQALATGWDCPREKIIVKLRENMSETFEIQTLGRLRRMPKAKHYDKEILDCSYLYTFDEKYKLEVIKAGNGFEAQRVFLKEEPKKIKLVKETRNLDGSYIDEQAIRNRVYAFLRISIIFPIQKLIISNYWKITDLFWNSTFKTIFNWQIYKFNGSKRRRG